MGVVNDVRYTWRVLLRSPAFAITALVSLTLGIGATSTTFALVRGVLWKPLPFAQPDRLVVVWETDEKHGFTNRNEASFADFLEWRDGADSFDHLTALAYRNLNLTGGGEPERLMAAAPSVDFFDMLGVRAIAGRSFTRDEERPEAAPTVMLSHGLWTRRFGADPAIVGRTVALSGVATTVIGVLPADFRFEFPTRRDIDIWVPRVVTLQARQSRRSRALYVVGRLKRDASIESAQARLSAIAARLAAEHPQTNAGWDVRVLPLHEQIAGAARTPLVVLLAAGVCLLLIVCANLGTLLLAQSSARHAEIAVRAALGASSGRLLRQFLVESAVLSTVGAVTGLVIAQFAIAALRSGFFIIDLPRIAELRLDPVVLLFAQPWRARQSASAERSLSCGCSSRCCLVSAHTIPRRFLRRR